LIVRFESQTFKSSRTYDRDSLGVLKYAISLNYVFNYYYKDFLPKISELKKQVLKLKFKI
jgi:hypothetical protein